MARLKIERRTAWTNDKGRTVATLVDGKIELADSIYSAISVEKARELHAALGDILTDLATEEVQELCTDIGAASVAEAMSRG